MTRPLLITNTTIFPGAHQAVRSHVDILIEDTLIKTIASTGTLAGEQHSFQELDGADLIAMPGFVNAHTHSNESFELWCYDAMLLELWLLFKYPPGSVRPISERWHYLRTMWPAQAILETSSRG